MSWSPAMRVSRRTRNAIRGGQMDWLDDPVLSYKLVYDGTDPLTNAMVAARQPHDCFTCSRTIVAGERVRRETRRSENGKRIDTRHVCAVCCEQIAEGGNPWRAT